MIECPDEDSFGLWLAALRALLAEREPPSAIGPAALLGSFGCELDQVALATRTPTLALTLDPNTGFIPKTNLNPEPELEPEPVPEPSRTGARARALIQPRWRWRTRRSLTACSSRQCSRRFGWRCSRHGRACARAS